MYNHCNFFLVSAAASSAVAGPFDVQDEEASKVALMATELLGEEGADE